MVRRQLLKPTGRDFLLTTSGARFLGRLGVDVEKARKERRAFARQCLDWSERRAHLAGALGAAVARRCLDLRWAAPVDEERTLRLTPQGLRGLRPGSASAGNAERAEAAWFPLPAPPVALSMTLAVLFSLFVSAGLPVALLRPLPSPLVAPSRRLVLGPLLPMARRDAVVAHRYEQDGAGHDLRGDDDP